MTLFWLKTVQPQCAPVASEPASDQPEFDEDGRRYVFRFTRNAPQRYHIDRDRIFNYAKAHDLPSARARALRRDLKNAANFYEDIRDIQTHPDVVALESETTGSSVTRLRLRSGPAQLSSAS